MPFKESQRNPNYNFRKKPTYKVINWSEYNKSLAKRGALTLYLPVGDLESILVNEYSYSKGVSGRTEYYTKGYVELIYLMYRVMNFGIRQMTGYFKDLWESKELDIAVPSFGHLSDLFASLDLKVKHYCKVLADRLKEGEDITLVFDSTGMAFDKASSWYETKYCRKPKNRPWRKLHLSIDPNMEVYGVEVTDNYTSDREMINSLIAKTDDRQKIRKLIADGGYYSAKIVQSLYDRGIIPVIPPPSNSVLQKNDNTSWHDKIVKYIKEKGIYAFYKKYGYCLRNKIEAQFSRSKRCIGSSFKTRKIESQKQESIAICNILNLWNSFGKPVTLKIS